MVMVITLEYSILANPRIWEDKTQGEAHMGIHHRGRGEKGKDQRGLITALFVERKGDYLGQ